MRTFLAIPLPADIQAELARVQAQVRAQMKHSKVFWTPIEHMHITLQFYGEREPAQVASVQQALRDIPAPPPFWVTLDSVGAFPQVKQPHVLYLVLHRNTDLETLHHRAKIITQQAGIPVDHRPWVPHVTLGRIQVRAEVVVPERIHVEQKRFEVTTIQLMESVFNGKQHEYQILEQYSL